MNEEKVLGAFSDLEGILMDDKEGLEALEVIQNAYNALKQNRLAGRKVYVVEDEKYGTQAIFEDKKIAEKERNTGKFHVSGYGAAIVEWIIQ